MNHQQRKWLNKLLRTQFGSAPMTSGWPAITIDMAVRAKPNLKQIIIRLYVSSELCISQRISSWVKTEISSTMRSRCSSPSASSRAPCLGNKDSSGAYSLQRAGCQTRSPLPKQAHYGIPYHPQKRRKHLRHTQPRKSFRIQLPIEILSSCRHSSRGARVQKPAASVERGPHLRQRSLHNLWPDPLG
jgi:hypothetical protein